LPYQIWHTSGVKKTLSFDRVSGHFKVDLGTPSKRFHLGSDATSAQDRKIALVKFWSNRERNTKGCVVPGDPG